MATVQTVIVTGGFGQLGRAVGRAFAATGARVALVDRAPMPAAPLPGAPDALLLGGVDLAQPAAADGAVAAAVSRFGRLDVLVNVAGGFAWQLLADGDIATWDQMYSINVRTAAVMSKAALPALLASGDARIVNIGAGAAVKAGAGMGAYAAAKAGVQRLTESLAEELKDRGVTVNAVLPSILDTPQNRRDMPDADFSRWVAPEALAEVIVFLASPAARAITGAAIPVSGRV